jgi:hypothetical protein
MILRTLTRTIARGAAPAAAPAEIGSADAMHRRNVPARHPLGPALSRT